MVTQPITRPPGLHPEALPPDFDQWDKEEPKKSKIPTHPAGKITAWDEKTSLPIVKRDEPEEESKPAPKGESKPVGATDPESGRVTTQPTDKLGEAQKLATDMAPELKEKLTEALKGIPGAKLEAVREEKDPDRAKEKATKEGQPPETISDLLAARISVDSPDTKDAVVAAIKQAFSTVKDEDQFSEGGDNDFHSHDLQLQMSNGATAELQILPKEQADIADSNHPLYEKARNGDAEAGESLKQQNGAAMDKFTARQSKPKETAPEQPGAKTPAPESQRLAKGSHVVTKDGRSATVDFHDARNTGNARVTTDDGEKIQSVSGKHLTAVNRAEPKDGKYIAVDLDKTLAQSSGGFKGPSAIGKPVPEMVARVKQWLKDGEDVRIFTARIANDPDGKAKRAIEAWSQHNLGVALPVTDKKDENMKEFYDDRARQVEPNTGKLVGGKEDENGSKRDIPKEQKEAPTADGNVGKPDQPANRTSSSDAWKSSVASRAKPDDKKEQKELVQLKPPKGHTVVSQHFRKLPT